MSAHRYLFFDATSTLSTHPWYLVSTYKKVPRKFDPLFTNLFRSMYLCMKNIKRID